MANCRKAKRRALFRESIEAEASYGFALITYRVMESKEFSC